MRNREWIYWICQLGGWGLFALGNILTSPIVDSDLQQVYKLSAMTFLMGIGISHVFRVIVHRLNWKHKLSIPALIPRVFVSSFLMGFFLVTFNTAVTDLLNGEVPLVETFFRARFLMNVINFWVLFFLWCILYFAVNTFENWKKEEIQNLELRAAKTEIELNSFKSQMNPHFMFNSLNSIRALVDEDPQKAKQAITMLSGIMRSNLLLGKKQTVTLREELDLVENYLSIEKIRFEERLHINMSIDAEALSSEIPPFMLQTIVENGIKHGISKIIEGGTVELKIERSPEFICIEIFNSGEYNPSEESDGFGIANTRKRLELLHDGKAYFHISNDRGGVVTILELPIK